MLLADLAMTGEIIVACGSDSDSSGCTSEYDVENYHDNYTNDEIEPNCCNIWIVWYRIVAMCYGHSNKPE